MYNLTLIIIYVHGKLALSEVYIEIGYPSNALTRVS